MNYLFNIPVGSTRGTYLDPRWSYVKRGLQASINRIESHYRSTPMNVPSNHPLIRVLYHFGPRFDLELNEYYSYVKSGADALSMLLGFSSSLQVGSSQPTSFFGPGVKELYLSHDESFDYRYINRHWTTARPLEVLSSPNTALSLDLLNNPVNMSSRGVAVISINIVKLMIQYRAFRIHEQQRSEASGGEYAQRTPMQFIHMFVLPGMMRSYVDACLVSRLRNYIMNEPVSSDKPSHSFKVINWTDRVDDVYLDLAMTLLSRPMHFNQLLKSILLVSSDTAIEFGRLPSVFPNRQITWLLILARLDLLEILMECWSRTESGENKSYVIYIQRLIKRMRRDRVWDSVVPKDIRKQLNDRLLYLEEM